MTPEWFKQLVPEAKDYRSSKGGSYGNKILYKNLEFFDFAVEDFVTLLMGKKILLMGKSYVWA